MLLIYASAIIGSIVQAAFIYSEYRKLFRMSLLLKTLASFFFCLIGYFGYRHSGSEAAKLIFYGLIFGLLGDFFLNLRYLYEKHAQKIFLVGILFFLIGHILYLVAIIPLNKNPLPWLIGGAVIAALLLAYIFKTMEVKLAFKIFGIFYLGAIIMMTSVAIGNLVYLQDSFSLYYAIGAILFTASDIILIFNTFGSSSKFSRRIANLSLYYLGQLLIACSLFFL